MKRLIYSLAVAVAILLGAARQAKADTVLVDLEDPASQYGTPFSATFTATSSSTTITFAGYNVPSFTLAEGISLTATGGGPNLLGPVWIYTPAPAGALAGQFPDSYGTGTNAVDFGGVVEDSFDKFSQTVGTTPGASYTLNFYLYTTSAPSELKVSEGTAATPEPASLTMLGMGILGLGGYAWRRRKGAAVPAAC